MGLGVGTGVAVGEGTGVGVAVGAGVGVGVGDVPLFRHEPPLVFMKFVICVLENGQKVN